MLHFHGVSLAIINVRRFTIICYMHGALGLMKSCPLPVIYIIMDACVFVYMRP